MLFLLFLLALYELVNAGFSVFAVICMSPIVVFMFLGTFQYRMFTFWGLILVNFFVQWKNFPGIGLPTSLYNEMLEIVLLALTIIDVKDSHYERSINVMFIALVGWCGFCMLEMLNDTCGLGFDFAGWYTQARLIGFSLMYVFLVFTLYINNPKVLVHYLFVWGLLSLFAVFWVWKQKNFGLTDAENSFLQGRGRSTHLLQGGTLIRYFSTYNDAANFGIGIACTAVAFVIFGITSRIKKYKFYFLLVGLACIWGMFPSGTRTAIACLMAGFVVYIFLSKSFKIAIPFTITFGVIFFILAFTDIGNGNQSIRRMRSAFDKNDASANQRSINQEAMKKYMKEAPWGIGMNVGYQNVPANNKYTFMATVPPDSEYVFIWIHTGIIGITVFLTAMFAIFAGAVRIVMFRLRSPSLRGIGAGMCCAFVGIQLGGYGNQVLLGFPNGLIFYGGITIVYILPFIEQEWIAHEDALFAKQEERRRLKEEQRKALRIKSIIPSNWF